MPNGMASSLLFLAAGIVAGGAVGFWGRGYWSPERKKISAPVSPAETASVSQATPVPAPAPPTVTVEAIPVAAFQPAVAAESANLVALINPVRPQIPHGTPLIHWLGEWAEHLSDVQKELDKANRTTPATLPSVTILEQMLRTLYQPQMPSASPPVTDEERALILPLLDAAFARTARLDREMRAVLDALPLLPVPGARFDGHLHDALPAYRRNAKTGETPGTVYRFLSPGLQHAGRVLLKAEVGLLDAARPGDDL